MHSSTLLIASVYHNMTIARPTILESSLYDNFWWSYGPFKVKKCAAKAPKDDISLHRSKLTLIWLGLRYKIWPVWNINGPNLKIFWKTCFIHPTTELWEPLSGPLIRPQGFILIHKDHPQAHQAWKAPLTGHNDPLLWSQESPIVGPQEPLSGCKGSWSSHWGPCQAPISSC